MKKNKITMEQALGAYETLRDYCKQHQDCMDCLLVVSEDGLLPDCCLMCLQDAPRSWQTLECD